MGKSRKVTLKKMILKGVILLAVITYFMVSLNGYHTYKYSKDQKMEVAINEQKLGINQKVKGLEKYLYVLENRIKEVEKYSDSYPLFLLNIQKMIRDITILNIEHGVSVNIIDSKEGKVITSSEAVPKDYFFKEIFQDGLSRQSFGGVSFLKNEREIGVVKKLKGLERYEVFFRVSRNLFFKNLRKENPFFMEYQGEWVGLPGDEIKKYKSETAKLKYREFGDMTFAIIKGDIYKEKLLMIFLWFFLPILPVVFVYYHLYKAIIRVFYNPLKKIAEEISSDDIKDKNIIEYLEEVYKEISERNKFLIEQSKKDQESFREVLMRKVILGIGSANLVKKYYPNEEAEYNFGVINITAFSQNIEEYLYIVSKLSLILKEKFNFEVIPVDNENLFFITEKKFEVKELEEILLQTENNETTVFAFLSMKKYNISELENKYKEFVKNLSYKGKYINKILITEKDLEKNFAGYTYYYPVDIEQKIFLRINNLNIQGILNIFEELFEENYTKRNLEGESLSRFKKAVVNSLDRIIIQFELTGLIEKTYKEYFEKRDSQESNDFKEVTYKILEDLVKMVKMLKGNDDESIEIKMKKFIENNYNREVSLNEFAEYMGFTPQYASNLFKRINGENFNVSINKYRIKKSVEIFQERKGQVKIKELAELVGYGSSITFINNFKKIHNTSPAKYLEFAES